MNDPLAANGPEKAARAFAVGPEGQVVFHSGYAPRDPYFTALDSSGTVIARFGREGAGPGEFRLVFWLGVRDSVLWAYDQAQFRLTSFSLDGRHLADHAFPPGSILADVVGDSILTFLAPDLNRPSLVLHRLSTGETTTVVPETDSVLAAVANVRSNWGPSTGVAAYADRITLATAHEYQLFQIERNRLVLVTDVPVPPRTRSAAEIEETSASLLRSVERGLRSRANANRAMERLPSEHLPHFRSSAVHYDGAGRLWILGQKGDSAFLDVFRDGRRLGRITKLCSLDQFGASVNGSWIGLLCRRTPEESMREVELHLYQIVEADEG